MIGAVLHPNVGIAELVWLLIGLIGLAVSGDSLRIAVADYRTVRALRVRAARRTLAVVARGQIVDEAMRCVIHALVATLGIVAMTIPPATPARITPLQIAVTGCLFGIVGLLVVKSLYDRLTRARVLELERGKR